MNIIKPFLKGVFSKNHLPVAALLLVGIAFRLPHLGSRGVWLDEAVCIDIASSKSILEILNRLQMDASPPLYYFFLHYWMKLFGMGELALRISSLLIGIGLLILIYYVMLSWFAKRESAFLAAFIVSLSPLAIFYSQEIRPYGLLALLALITLWCLHKALSGGKTGWWLLYVLGFILTFLTHYSGFPALAAIALFALIQASYRKQMKQFLWSHGLLLIAFLLWLPEFQHHSRNSSSYAFAFDIWKHLGVTCLWSTYKSFTGGEFPRYFINCETSWGAPLLHFVYGAAIINALYLIFCKNGSGQKPYLISLALLGFLPPLLLLLSGIAGKPAYIPARTDFVAYPALAMLAGYGLSRFPSFTWAIFLIIMMPVLGQPLNGYYNDPLRPIDREVCTRYVPSIAHYGDGVILTGLFVYEHNYYLRQSPLKFTIFAYPPDPMVRSLSPEELSLSYFQALAKELEKELNAFMRKAPPGQGIVVLLQLGEPRMEPLTDILERNFRQQPNLKPLHARCIQGLPGFLVVRLLSKDEESSQVKKSKSKCIETPMETP